MHSRLPDAVLGDVQAARVCARNLQVLPTMSCLMPRGGRSHGVMHARHGLLARLDNAQCMRVPPDAVLAAMQQV